MRTHAIVALAAVLAAAGAVTVAAQSPSTKVDGATVDRFIAATFKGASAEWKKRIEPDETQRICSQFHNQLPPDEFKKVLAREKATVKLPADGKVIGDWRKGQQIAQRGTGGQFSDRPDTFKGGNCYACHQLSRAELSFGTMGPSLTGYGKDRKFSPDAARDAYAKIYNAQSVLPCSNMPRFGHSGFLGEQQIKDAVAYLFDPESPVNK